MRTSGARGKQLRERRLDALRALADRRELVATARAGEWHRLLGAAVMACEKRARQVHGEARVAGLAGRDPAAAGAEHRRRVAAAIQEHEHLALVAEMPLDCGRRRRGEPVARRIHAKVDDRDARFPCAPRALRQRHLRVAPRGGVRERLERRRRRTEHDRHAGALRACNSEVAAGVAESFLLLVRSIVLLVDDDEAERRHRREYGRARADHDGARPEARGAPGLEPRAVGERGVQRDDRAPRAAARKRATSCGVSAISGTSTSAPRPDSSTRSMSRRYTSVFPLPVTPCSSQAPNFPSDAPIASTAAPWSAVSTGPGRPAPAGGGASRPGNGFEPAALHKRAHGGRVPRGRDGCSASLRPPPMRSMSACWRGRDARRRDRGAPARPRDARGSRRARPPRRRAASSASRRTARRRADGGSSPPPSAAGRMSPSSQSGVVSIASTTVFRRARGSALDSACAATTPIARRRPSGTRTRSPGRGTARRRPEVVEALPQRRVENDLEYGRTAGKNILLISELRSARCDRERTGRRIVLIRSTRHCRPKARAARGRRPWKRTSRSRASGALHGRAPSRLAGCGCRRRGPPRSAGPGIPGVSGRDVWRQPGTRFVHGVARGQAGGEGCRARNAGEADPVDAAEPS